MASNNREMQVKLSVVIITFNEEVNISRCLDSIKDISDEIIVVDSYSTDKTEEICRSYAVKFIQHKFEGHIEQKNFASTQTTYQHVLSLDADEALSSELKQSIINAKNDWKADGYSMNRLTNYCGKWIHHCGWYPDTKIRLMDKTKGKWDGDNPHDQFIMQQGSQVIHLKGDILHYSYYTLDDHYKQVEYFTSILSKSQFAKGKKAPLFMVYTSPIVKFIKFYFIHLGILDGRAGYTISSISAFATYMKYKKLRQLYLDKIRNVK